MSVERTLEVKSAKGQEVVASIVNPVGGTDKL